MSQVTEATEGISWNRFYFVPFDEPKENSSIGKRNFLSLTALGNDIGMLLKQNLKHGHKCLFCTLSRSSTHVFKFRVGNRHRNMFGGKRRKHWTKARMFKSPQAWNVPRHQPFLHFTAWLLLLLLTSLSLEGSPLFHISLLKFSLRESPIKLSFWQTLEFIMSYPV